MKRYNIENPREIDWEKGIINLKNEGINYMVFNVGIIQGNVLTQI